MNETLIKVFTGVVAASTLIYAGFIGWLACETRKIRKAQTEPRVGVRVSLVDGSRMILEIRNQGQGLAKNISFEFNNAPNYFDGELPVGQLPAIEKGLPYLETGQSFSYPLGTATSSALEKAAKSPWTFVVSYSDVAGHSSKETYNVDFNLFQGLTAEWPNWGAL